QVLVLHGLFPMAPKRPRMAILIRLLDFYQALFEKSCEAVNALSATLSNFYRKHGFIVTDHEV
ncbi:hypothetical protein BDQ17DRAFT_1218874, partial [Cyathus striatus]